LLHRRSPDELAAGFVRGEEIAGKDPGDLFLFVEADVEQKARTCPQGDVAQFLPQRVALCDAEGGARVADVFRPVIAHDRFEPGATRHDSFRAPAETGEEMRFNKTGDDADIGFDEVTIDERWSAVPRGAELHESTSVFRFVIEHAVVCHHMRREHRYLVDADV